MANKSPSKLLRFSILLIIGLAILIGVNLLIPPATTPGEVVFRNERPEKGITLASALTNKEYLNRSSTWLSKSWDAVATWEKNPWQRKRFNGGGHYYELSQSTDPADQAEAQKIRDRATELYQRVLQRYPELAPDMKDVPPERNGFLMLVELENRLDADPTRDDRKQGRLGIPNALRNHLRKDSAWNAETAKAWLTKEHALIEELRTIGLCPDQSINGIELNDSTFNFAVLAVDATYALLLDARIAAESGNIPRALESVEAANGISTHLVQVETPNPFYSMIRASSHRTIQEYVFSAIIPAIPEGQRNPVAWQTAVDPQVLPPSELARIIKGEWNQACQLYLFPMLSDPEELHFPSDPDLLIDLQASYSADLASACDSLSISDWNNLPATGNPYTPGLSRESSQILEMAYIGDGWFRDLKSAQAQASLSQAAFAIMQGEAIPPDPIQGLPYQWDPATRELSLPKDPCFTEMNLEPIIVPSP